MSLKGALEVDCFLLPAVYFQEGLQAIVPLFFTLQLKNHFSVGRWVRYACGVLAAAALALPSQHLSIFHSQSYEHVFLKKKSTRSYEAPVWPTGATHFAPAYMQLLLIVKNFQLNLPVGLWICLFFL